MIFHIGHTILVENFQYQTKLSTLHGCLAASHPSPHSQELIDCEIHGSFEGVAHFYKKNVFHAH